MSAWERLMQRVLARRHAYRVTFDSELARVVLGDLARFCGATKSSIRIAPLSGTIDPLAMAIAEGRREVWLRIVGHLHLSDADLVRVQTPPAEDSQ